MVYGFVKQSNGHVSIYSEPYFGDYDTNIFVLPGRPRSLRNLEGKSRPAPDRSRGVPKRCLVVEDDPFVRSYSIKSVESLGYSVISQRSDGNDALQKLRADIPVDILFTFTS